MTKLPRLPEAYYQQLKELEASYLSHSDPLRQSGYGGGSINWRKKRGVVLEAAEDGSRQQYFDNLAFLTALGIRPVGSVVSDPPGAEYVWMDC